MRPGKLLRNNYMSQYNRSYPHIRRVHVHYCGRNHSKVEEMKRALKKSIKNGLALIGSVALLAVFCAMLIAWAAVLR
jgi:hypothetical protein